MLVVYNKYTNSILKKVDDREHILNCFVGVVLRDCLVFVSDNSLDGDGVQIQTIALADESVPCLVDVVVQFQNRSDIFFKVMRIKILIFELFSSFIETEELIAFVESFFD